MQNNLINRMHAMANGSGSVQLAYIRYEDVSLPSAVTPVF